MDPKAFPLFMLDLRNHPRSGVFGWLRPKNWPKTKPKAKLLGKSLGLSPTPNLTMNGLFLIQVTLFQSNLSLNPWNKSLLPKNVNTLRSIQPRSLLLWKPWSVQWWWWWGWIPSVSLVTAAASSWSAGERWTVCWRLMSGKENQYCKR